MTNEELQTVVAAVIQALKTNGKTIAQLTPVTSLANSDSLEVSGGKKIAFSKLKELVASAVVVTEESIKGWVPIESTEDLPEEPTPEEQEKAYIIAEDSMLYVYVGEGGDTLDGLYQSVELQGPQGETGPAGADGHDGVDLGEVALINDLTTGGEGSALSAEQGKRIAQHILGGEGVRETISCNALCIKGGYYDNSGNFMSSNSYKYTTKINLTNVLRLDVSGSYGTKVWYFGSDGTTIKGSTNTAVVKKENFPADSVYCAISYNVNSTANISIDYVFAPYILGEQQGDCGYAKFTAPVGKYNLDASTGVQEYNASWIGVLGFIPLYNALSIYIPDNQASQGIICFYDENFAYLEGSAYTQYKIIPANAKYCKVRVIASSGTPPTSVDIYLYGAKINSLSSSEKTRKIIDYISPKPLHGKKIAFLGDSITSTPTYGLYMKVFAEMTGANCTSYAVASKTYADGEIAAQASSLAGDENVIVMMGGTNDFGHNSTIGDIYSESGGALIPTTDTTTMCGGLHAAINAIYTKCPTAQIVIITPPQRSTGWTANTQGKYLYEYADAIKKVAQLYGIPVVDQFANCGINPVMSAMKSAYFNSDGTHPNNTYHMLLAKWLYNAIATWVKEPYG